MHWFSRATIAVVAGSAFVALYSVYLWDTVVRAVYAGLTGSRNIRFQGWQWIATLIITFLPALLVTFVVYGLLTRFLGTSVIDPETRCRKCGYILRGISEPRCSECGERI